MNLSPDSSPYFRKVSAGRVSDAIVDQIKTAIREGKLTTGDRLPPERELTKMFGVSRVAVRDALRLLEASGLVEVRVGAAGGAVVTVPGSDEIADSISNMLLIRSTTPQEVTEARLVLEVGVIRLACERADESDIADLDAVCDRAGRLLASEGEYDVALSAEFHSRLGAATHNEVIRVLIASLHQPLEDSLRRARDIDPAMGRIGTEEHRHMVRAIEARDADDAEEVMRRHLLRTADRLAVHE
ncbi:MAG TPA: FadR/GntR family transcriptional regulator [Acidimicrobiia bacterium]|nr:FadR/GntR family transcriptional regulator [Acidimicrobiia bacterium]